MIFKETTNFLHRTFITLVVLLSVLGLTGTPGLCVNSKIIVVASTSWTGAIAAAAGADEVRVLAPMELKHPPEYDYRPSDMARLEQATAFVYAGYEPFAKKLLAASNFSKTGIYTVVTTNVPAILKQQARTLAEKLGTQAKEAQWEAQFDRTTNAILQRAAHKKVDQIKVLVQQHQQPFVKWLGYNIVGVFGAEELSPAKVMSYSQLRPELVIDNFHNPQGKPIVEVTHGRYVELINFPAAKAPTLIDLFVENARRLGL